MKKFAPLFLASLALCASQMPLPAASDALPSDTLPGAVPASGKQKKPVPAPTYANVHYGSDPLQVLDFYQAKSDKPTPVMFFIHGGGWVNGDKALGNSTHYTPQDFLDAGISIVSIDYRKIPDAVKQGLVPPVQAPLGDAARALQFVRSKAAEWNIDKTRIGAGGSSAGACSSLWLAFHKDMADPKSADPVARESTKLSCVGLLRAQTSLDPKVMKEWVPNMNYGGPFFGFKGSNGVSSFDEFLANRDKVIDWIKEYSPYDLATKDAPPVYISYDMVPAMGQPQQKQAHSANQGLGLQEKLNTLGVQCIIAWPGHPDPKYPTAGAFLIDKLKQPSM